MKRKYGSNSIEINNLTILCDYGCGQLAKFHSNRTNKYRCAKSANSCPQKRKNISESLLNPEKINDSTLLCDWGCNQTARYKFKNGKVCCREINSLCPTVLASNSRKNSEQKFHATLLLNDSKICDYGCNQIAEYRFENGKVCCSKTPNGCLGKQETTIKNCRTEYGVDYHVQREEIQERIEEGRVRAGSWVSREEKTDKELYYILVQKVTEKSWKSCQNIINLQNLPRNNEHHLDHIFSKNKGFKLKIPPEIIGHWTNLQILTRSENDIKHSSCWKTEEQLYEDYYNYTEKEMEIL